jgi:hypothetical protein
MHISIVVPYPNAAGETTIWAQEEASIDFRCDSQRAARCTVAFAATELNPHRVSSGPEPACEAKMP